MDRPDTILENIILSEYSWFGVGGPAKYFLHANSKEEFIAAVSWAKKNNIQIHILGLGANILIADDGFQGLIIKMPHTHIGHHYINESNGILQVDAGYSLEDTITYAIENAYLFGLEEFSGIPSSIGAAVFINLHYYEFFIAQFIHSVTIYDINNGAMYTFDQPWCKFGYDDSTIKNNKNYIVVSVDFILKRGSEKDSWFAQGRKKEIIRHRHNRYPHQYTCGCFFKNFDANNPLLSKAKTGKIITAASYYLDQVGAKSSCRSGSAAVSWQHANMIIHTGKATAADIIAVAIMMQEKVYQKFGLILEPECELLGFLKYPLLTSSSLISK